jgi:hypothetical protein
MIEPTSLLDNFLVLLALGAALFVVYGWWLVITRDQPRPPDRERGPAEPCGE